MAAKKPTNYQIVLRFYRGNKLAGSFPLTLRRALSAAEAGLLVESERGINALPLLGHNVVLDMSMAHEPKGVRLRRFLPPVPKSPAKPRKAGRKHR
jgi:hypothetical protein